MADFAMSSAQFAVGAHVFVPDETDAYAAAEVVHCSGFGDGAVLRVRTSPGAAEWTVPPTALSRVCEADPLSLSGADDMVKFTLLTDAAVLQNLRVRYSRDSIYSSAGSILVSVNPFKQVPLYSPDLMARCKVHACPDYRRARHPHHPHRSPRDRRPHLPGLWPRTHRSRRDAGTTRPTGR